MTQTFTIDSIEGNSYIGVPVFSRFGQMQNYNYIVMSPQKKVKVKDDGDVYLIDEENQRYKIDPPDMNSFAPVAVSKNTWWGGGMKASIASMGSNMKEKPGETEGADMAKRGSEAGVKSSMTTGPDQKKISEAQKRTSTAPNMVNNNISLQRRQFVSQISADLTKRIEQMSIAQREDKTKSPSDEGL